MSERVLINFPTNIGDTILGLPVLDRVKTQYPSSTITAIASAHTKDFLSKNTFINEVKVFDKRWKLSQKISFSCSLRLGFDLVVDLKNSFLPVLIGGKHTPFVRRYPRDLHAKDNYLKLLDGLCPVKETLRSDFTLSAQEKERFASVVSKRCIFVACASRHFSKSYPSELLMRVMDDLKKRFTVVVLGSEVDRAFYKEALKDKAIIDVVGKTSLAEVFYLLKESANLLISVDSSILHLASYLDIPIVALFGPTNQKRYGPWSSSYETLTHATMSCVPCEDPHCKFNSECMQIEPQRVVEAALALLK